MKVKSIILLSSFILSLSSCHTSKAAGLKTVDPHTTAMTKKLYKQLMQIPKKGIMFGQQDATLYGIGWKYDKDRSDVKSVCGDYPAVYGWEVGHIELESPYSLDSIDFNIMRSHIVEAYQRGGINTISWHCNNPLTGGNSWDVSRQDVVASILPNGANHALFLTWLDRLATFLNSLQTPQGEKIPILFRPFHEHTGNWFWWGKEHCSIEEYKALFKLTVDYLKEKEVHNLLYIYSPDRSDLATTYFERYPGDEYVDILGLDCYHHGGEAGAKEYMKVLQTTFTYLSRESKARNKPLVFSETGSETVPMENWWTDVLLKAITPYPISYVLVWRNAYEKPNHYFGPYPGQLSDKNFKLFYQDERTLFQKDIKSK